MFKRLTTTALVFGMAALAPPALAQMLCGPRAALTGTLATTFGEELHALGLAGPNQIVEVWLEEESRAWTILVTRPDNLSCVVARGSDWTLFDAEGELAAEIRPMLNHD